MSDILRKQNRMMNGPAITAGQIPYRNVTVEDKLDELDNRASANTLGTAVDITSYTSSSKYTCPSDGYIFLDATAISVTNGSISVAIDAGSNPILWGAARKSFIESNIICARKGMQIYVGHVDTGGKAYFYPLEGSALPSAESEGF